jgi:CheY-like chemotaxis protein
MCNDRPQRGHLCLLWTLDCGVCAAGLCPAAIRTGHEVFSRRNALVPKVQTDGTGGSLKLILLVDDSKFMRRVNERALARAGYDVATASDGEEALQIARTRIPDLILLDMLLPKLGGQEVLQALRRDPFTASIPVVVLSSLPQKNAAKLLKDGASAYFEKSQLEPDQNAEFLLQNVKKILDDRRASRGALAEAMAPVADRFS